MRRILGIDPGSRITGYGIIEQRPGQTAPVCITAGCIRLESKEMPPRLAQLFSEIQLIVKTFQPTELAIEQVFVNKNPRSALMLGQARGVAIAAMASTTIPVFEYAPRQIKQAVVGRGSADKNQVQKMIQILLTLPQKPASDAADALAVALCHYHMVSIAYPLPVTKTRRRSSKRSTQWKTYDRTTSR